jgi:ribosome-associated protein
MVDEASIRPVYRVPTRPTKASKERRLKAKTTRASIKSGRGKPSLD